MVASAIAAVDPGALVARACASESLLWDTAQEIRVLAVGKAAEAMAVAAAPAIAGLGGRVVDGLRVGLAVTTAPFTAVVAEHPVPGDGSLRAGQAALGLARANRERAGHLLVLLSGGASSMLALPASGLSLLDKRAATATLLRQGAPIHGLNAVRKHLSAIKGGWLGVEAGRSLTWAISDVADDDVSVIGSGPTAADPSTYAEALDVIETYGGRACYPPAVVTHLERGRAGVVAETPKPGDPRLDRASIEVIASRATAMQGAAAEARRRGYAVVVMEAPVVGEARVAAGTWLRGAIERLTPLGRPACVISSGETTVRVAGPGTGGRNQEFALALAAHLEHEPHALAAASVGTDGVDGPTGAAGAIVDVKSASRARSMGIAPIAELLACNDSQTYFRALDDLIVTGPTGTNVGDLQLLVVA